MLQIRQLLYNKFLNEGLVQQETSPFVPHATIMKLSKLKGSKKPSHKIDRVSCSTHAPINRRGFHKARRRFMKHPLIAPTIFIDLLTTTQEILRCYLLLALMGPKKIQLRSHNLTAVRLYHMPASHEGKNAI